MLKQIMWRPYKSKAGMTRTYEELVLAWGEPHTWPKGVADVVCDRGDSVPFVFDRDIPAGDARLRWPAGVLFTGD